MQMIGVTKDKGQSKEGVTSEGSKAIIFWNIHHSCTSLIAISKGLVEKVEEENVWTRSLQVDIKLLYYTSRRRFPEIRPDEYCSAVGSSKEQGPCFSRERTRRSVVTASSSAASLHNKMGYI